MIINILKNTYNFFFNYRTIKRYNTLIKSIGINKTIQLQTDIKVDYPENLSIKDYVYIGPNARIQAIGKVKIDRGTIIGPDLRVYSANHKFRNATSIPYDKTYIKKEVIIGQNVWIGGGVILLPGVTVGEGAIIGAGSVVSKQISKMSIVAGNPAKVIGHRDEDLYNKLKEEDKIYLKLKQSNSL